jgi:hypothetical protein
MTLGGVFRAIYDFLAQFGLIVRDDPRKVIDLTSRQWGETVEGLALSIEELPRIASDELPAVSAVLRNAGSGPRQIVIPGWLFFFDFEVTNPDGSTVALGSFGRQLLRLERKTERIELTLAPGGVASTEVPVGSLFDLSGKRSYRIRLLAKLDSGKILASNMISTTNR